MSYDDPAYRVVCRLVADEVFETVRKQEINVAMDALGMAMTRVLMASVPAPGRTHRQVWEDFLDHVTRSGESALRVLDDEGGVDNVGT